MQAFEDQKPGLLQWRTSTPFTVRDYDLQHFRHSQNPHKPCPCKVHFPPQPPRDFEAPGGRPRTSWSTSFNVPQPAVTESAVKPAVQEAAQVESKQAEVLKLTDEPVQTECQVSKGGEKSCEAPSVEAKDRTRSKTAVATARQSLSAVKASDSQPQASNCACCPCSNVSKVHQHDRGFSDVFRAHVNRERSKSSVFPLRRALRVEWHSSRDKTPASAAPKAIDCGTLKFYNTEIRHHGSMFGSSVPFPRNHFIINPEWSSEFVEYKYRRNNCHRF